MAALAGRHTCMRFDAVGDRRIEVPMVAFPAGTAFMLEMEIRTGTIGNGSPHTLFQWTNWNGADWDEGVHVWISATGQLVISWRGLLAGGYGGGTTLLKSRSRYWIRSWTQSDVVGLTTCEQNCINGVPRPAIVPCSPGVPIFPAVVANIGAFLDGSTGLYQNQADVWIYQMRVVADGTAGAICDDFRRDGFGFPVNVSDQFRFALNDGAGDVAHDENGLTNGLLRGTGWAWYVSGYPMSESRADEGN